MRKFMKIVETITTDYATNEQIESKLAYLPSDDRTMVLDGMEIMMNAGTITVTDWVHAMRNLYPVNNDEMKRIHKIILATFPDLVQRTAPSTYQWVHQAAAPVHHTDGDDDIDMNNPMVQLAKAQIQYTAFINELMRTAGTFHPHEIVARFEAGAGVPNMIADQLVRHVIDHSKATVKPVGDGSYRWEDYKAKSGLGFLRDLEGYQQRDPD